MIWESNLTMFQVPKKTVNILGKNKFNNNSSSSKGNDFQPRVIIKIIIINMDYYSKYTNSIIKI